MTVIWRYIKYSTRIAFLVAAFVGCTRSDYTKLVMSELAKGSREDSVLLGIYFGDTRDEFYGKCFDLNKEKIVTNGPNGASVQYIFTDSLVHEEPTQVRLLFYPDFDSTNVISAINLEFNYTGWAPWNRKLQSDSLKSRIMELLTQWYGGNEFVIAHVNDKDVPVKLDANRRVLVYVEDPQRILVRIQDILHPKFRHSVSSGSDKEGREN